ncbi:protein FAM160B1 isoform X2 [Exaiptasia diaphana]|uniref:FHF complex subunit HOOK-interacting protein C-terminal domain-containing protein n=1 Tax=Exaiptasia diaphana TaxID=2652724 RepID=A0A913WSC4_EXADI|nr:protein FAM160B1 isoform X2 [Exaiptasia diaphana]
MLSKIKSLVNEAVEALAPDLPPQESFVFHWKAVTNYFIEATDEKVPVHSTNIPYHLGKMLYILKKEEEDATGGSTGPCLEYLLQHKILDTLHTLGRADCPPGMKQEVLSFFANLLAKMHQPLLPHVNVYRPVHRLIRLCGEVRAAPSENEEVHFLCTVCSKLRQDPYLVNFFLEFSALNSCSCIACQQAISKDSPNDAVCSLEKNDPTTVGNDTGTPTDSRRRDKPDYTLVNSLLNLMKSEDSRIGVKACEGLMLCASLPEDHAATVIILYTPFCEIMADRLNPLFEALPQSMDPNGITDVSAKWGLDHIDNDEDIATFPGKRQLISFLSWFDYVDQLCKESHKLVGRALAVSIRERFLHQSVEPRFMQQSEQGVITTTAIIRRCLKSITSRHLLMEFSVFLLGEQDKPEVQSQGENGHRIRQKLIERCDHISDELSIETLKLLETLLLKPCSIMLDTLVICNLRSRKYYDSSNLENGTSADEVIPPSPKTPITPPLTPDGVSPLTIVTSAGDVEREEVVKIVNSFLSLVPEQVKSSALTGDTGYDTYLRDAHKQHRERSFQCCQFEWPSSPTSSNSDDDTRGVFYEGAFLNMLFKKLQRLLDQTYDINLHVTSVIALLAQFSHPNLHEYLLNPHLPVKPGCTTLYSTLENVVKDLNGRIERLPNFQKSVVTIRKQLMGIATSPDQKSMANNNLLEACIVLEEFCKELAAIAFVKTTATLHSQ